MHEAAVCPSWTMAMLSLHLNMLPASQHKPIQGMCGKFPWTSVRQEAFQEREVLRGHVPCSTQVP